MGTQGMSRKLAEALLSPLQLAQFLGVSRAALKVWRRRVPARSGSASAATP